MKIEFAPGKWIEMNIDTIAVMESTICMPPFPETIEGFDYVVTVDNTIKEEIGLVYVIVDIQVRDQSEIQLGRYKVSCTFDVANIRELDLKGEAGKPIRSQLASIWNSVAISTARGMMFSDFKGTFLHNAILPIVNPAQHGQDSKL